MEIAITGASGFVGGTLVRKHLGRGDAVRALVRDPAAAVCGLPLVRAFCGDLARGETIPPDFCAGADVLYHCAAEMRDERQMQATNVEGSRALARAAAGRIGRWVHVSSASVYGPVRSGTVTEASPPQPDSAYGLTKSESEAAVQSAAAAGGFELAILRPTNIFGVGMPSQALYKLFSAVERGWFFPVGTPGAVMSYVDVESVAAAAVLCAVHPAAAGGIYNISDEMPLERLAAIVADELGTTLPALRLPEAPLRLLAGVCGMLPGVALTHRHLDAVTTRARYASDRIHDELGFHPAIGFEAGLRALVRDWKRNRGRR